MITLSYHKPHSILISIVGTIKDWNNLPINVIEARDLLTYLMLTIVINYVCDCTIWGYYPLGIPAVLTAQYIILNLKLVNS